MGTEHPEFSDLAFEQYQPKKADRGYVRPPEFWTYKEVLKERTSRRFQQIKDTRRRRQLWISNYKIETGCVTCGYNEHGYCLDLDHIDPETKTPTNSASRLSFKPLEEIKKLIDSGLYQVLCAICHRIKTSEQKEYYNKEYIKP